ncbi:hypothetical protein J6590_029802 [Homalodisca vitripennis]|nr:hypothetical protein J6590_029802 [Homalodisca vitripennis]
MSPPAVSGDTASVNDIIQMTSWSFISGSSDEERSKKPLAGDIPTGSSGNPTGDPRVVFCTITLLYMRLFQ